MRHLTAVHVDLESGSGWHYASTSKRGGHPVGHCMDHAPHETEDDARRCYRGWQREQVRLDVRSSNWLGCEAEVDGKRCDAPTKTHAMQGGYSTAALCPDHLTIEHAIAALHLDGDLAGDAWVS